MKVVDNRELEKVMEKLESMKDEELAVKLLAKLNDKTKTLGLLIRNLDPKVSTQEWKEKCDSVQKEIEQVVKEIYRQD